MNKVFSFLKRLHNCDRGAEGFEKLLIVAALALPLLGVLIFFGGEIKEWLTDTWGDVRDDSDTLGGNPILP